MDQLTEWRLFHAVAAHRSFIRAARSHGRSPQSVTRAIAALEARLGVRLFHRTTRSVTLTSDGERYLERSRRALAELDALESSDASAALTGTLSITAPVMFGQLHVGPLVVRFLDAHPALGARLFLADRIVSLAEEGIDVAVRIGALRDSSLLARKLGHVRTVLCASPGYLERAGMPSTPRDLSGHACIAFAGTTPIAERWSFGGARDQSVAVRPRLVVNTAQAAIDAAAAGLGLVRVLSYQIEPLVRAGALRIVLADHEPPRAPVHLVHLPGIQPRAAVAFAERADEELRRVLER